MILLDTNICIHIINAKPPAVLQRFRDYRMGEIGLCMAFLTVFLGVSWPFLLFPVLSGSLLLVLMAWAFSRWVPGAMRYPLHWL